MNPLTFPCPHCNRRMGVRLEYAGKSVRCPHCREVVVAPVVSTAPTTQTISQPAASFTPPPRETAESILAEPEESDDSLFSVPSDRKVPILPPQEPIPSPNPISPVTAIESNLFEMTSSQSHPPASANSRTDLKSRSKIGLSGSIIVVLALYSILMTGLAVWGWLR